MLRQKQTGFTIVELLIVIVVIGILAALVISAFSGAQDRAKASSVITNLTAGEKAFRLLAAEQGRTAWWLDNELTGSGNPTLDTLISTTDFKKYMQSLPRPNSLSGTTWIYDNDGDNYGGCDNGSSGVNINTWPYSAAIAQLVDDQLDDGNLSCGNVRYNAGVNNGEIRFNMSRNSNQSL